MTSRYRDIADLKFEPGPDPGLPGFDEEVPRVDPIRLEEIGPGYWVHHSFGTFQGIVVRTFDDADGRRTHRVLAWRGKAPYCLELHDDDIDLDDSQRPAKGTITHDFRDLALAVARSRGVASERELEWLHDALDLCRVVLG